MTRFVCLFVLLAACGHREPASSVDAAAGGDGTLGDATRPPVDAAPPIDGPYVPMDPFTIPPCQAMTFAQLVTYFPPGGTTAAAGAFTLTSRARASCNEITGCSPWVEPSPVELQQIFDRAGVPAGTAHALPATGGIELTLDTTSSTPSISIDFSNAEPGASDTIDFHCGAIQQGGVGDTLDCSVEVQFTSDYPSLLWFVDTYLGQPLFDNTTLVEWQGRICDGGGYQLVTKLATDLGTSVTGANNRNQIAVYGQL